MRGHKGEGFTLLEVLVAMVVLSVAVVALIQLSSQGLRLLKLSGDHQEAVALADRLARSTDASAEGLDSGQEGPFTWERRVRLVAVPDELLPISGPAPRLLSLSVAVRWSSGRTIEVATLRLATGPTGTP